MDLRVKLLQVHFSLAVFNQRAGLISLHCTVAKRNVQSEANTLVGRRAIHQTVQHSTLADRWNGIGRACSRGCRENVKATRTLCTASGTGAIKAVRIESRQQGVASAPQRDLIFLDRKHGLLQFRPIRERLLYQLLWGLLLFRQRVEVHAIGRNNRSIHKSRIVQVTCNCLLEGELLIIQITLRTDQRLLVRGHGRIGIDHIERRHGADLELLPRIAVKLCALLERPLLRLHVFIRADNNPVDVLHLVYRGKNLLTEGGVGDASVENRLIDEAFVHPDARPLQKVLRHSGSETRFELRAVVTEKTIRGNAAIVPTHLQRGAGDESLVIREVVFVCIRESTWREYARLWRLGTFKLNRTAHHGVAILRRRPCTVGGNDDSRASGGCPTPGAPLWLSVCDVPPNVFCSTVALTPRNSAPDLARSKSVSAMSR